MSLSELSFIVLSDNYSADIKNLAYKEITRRFSNNGCNYNIFMKYEEEAISKRGNEMDRYLISPNPDGQLLIELYFNYVYGYNAYEVGQHGNLLFSENLICNSNSQKSFFVKAIKIELNNIKNRMAMKNSSFEDFEMLNLVYNILSNRCNKKQEIWYENSLTDCVMDIVPEYSSLLSDKRNEKMKKCAEKCINGSRLAQFQHFLYSSIIDSEIIDYLNMTRIANYDLSKLSQQKKSIIASLKSGKNVDYSFIDDERKQRILSHQIY